MKGTILTIPFTLCINDINNTHIDNAIDIDIVILMHNSIEYSGNYSKACGSLWQYCKDIPAVNDNVAIVDFGADVTDWFNIKEKITGQAGSDETKDVEIAQGSQRSGKPGMTMGFKSVSYKTWKYGIL